MFQGPSISASDFDCYEPRKWKSNVYNRERMEVKQKLTALGRECAGQLLGSDGSPLFLEASVEHPALWNHKQVDNQSVFFSRHEAARKELDGIIDRQKPIASLLDDPTPQRNHLFLAITLHHESLEVSLKLHPDATIDRQNLERKLQEHYEGERLMGLFEALPAGFHIGVLPDLQPLAAYTDGEGAHDAVDVLALAQILDMLPAAGSMSLPGHPQRMLYIGRSIQRSEVLGLTAAEQLAWIAESLELLLPIYRFMVWSRDNDFVSMRQVLDKERNTRRQKGLHKNDKVRIVRGMLAGKDGVVQEVDAKGHLKILVGKMVLKIDAADVERPDA
jgi:hypothetical protein